MRRRSENVGKFVKGHIGYKSMLGKHHTEKSRERMSDAKMGKPSWNKGIPHTEETIKKIRDKRKLQIMKPRTQKSKDKQSLSITKVWCNNKNMGMTGKHHSEETKKKFKLLRAQRVLPKKDTSIELKIQNELSSKHIQFWKHYPTYGQPDIVIQKSPAMAIFCDGDYWHNRPEVKVRDYKINEQLRAAGWLVLRYWEHEINANVEGVVDEIENILLRENYAK